MSVTNTRVKLDMGKQKDDEEGPVETFRLKLIELAGEVKEDGSPVTSLVLLPVGDQGDDEEPGEGSVAQLVRQLDAANVPSGWGNRLVVKACKDLGIRAGKDKIEAAVRIRKNRTTDVPGESGERVGSLRTPDAGEHSPVSAGQTFPGNVRGTSGNGTPDVRSPDPVPKDGGTSDAPYGKDGPLGLCDVCFKVMTLKPGMTRHSGCTPKYIP